MGLADRSEEGFNASLGVLADVHIKQRIVVDMVIIRTERHQRIVFGSNVRDVELAVPALRVYGAGFMRAAIAEIDRSKVS